MKNLYLLPILLIALSAVISAQNPAQAVAEQRARALVQVISSGSRAEAQKFINENYSDEFLKIPMGAHLGYLSTAYDASRGLEVLSVQDSTPNSATLLLKNKLTGEYQAIYVGVEDKAPYKISGIGGRQPRTPAAATKKLSDREIAAEMEAFVKKLTNADVFSGAVLLARDGQPVFEGAYGTANKDFNVPNKIDTKFNLGSMNKMFTATAIAQLVEKGKLSFDDPLSKFIPDFPDAESAKKIRIKHLLSHTAGLGGYFTKRYQDMSRAKLRTVDDMMALARQDEKLLFEPGSKWQYSNTGMLVLGKVIEIVSGQSYYDYVRENIFKPAGMTNTDCYELDKVNTNLAVGYDKQFTDNGVTWSNNIFEHVMRGGPQGGGFSTVEDLLKFDRALRSGKLVSREMVKTLTSPKPELNSPGYGYGFEADAEHQAAGHSGGFIGINSNLTMYLGTGWTAIVMSNYSRGAGPVITKMENLVNSAGVRDAAEK